MTLSSKRYALVLTCLLIGNCLLAQTSMTDPRDGQIYQTIAIGQQTWMAQNLNYKTDSSWCYLNDTLYCQRYGRLYTLRAALKACPQGWHLPDDKEWMTLELHLGLPEAEKMRTGPRGESIDLGNRLKAPGKWHSMNAGATKATGFNALPAGYRHYYGEGSFQVESYFAGFWSSTVRNGHKARTRGLNDYDANIIRDANDHRNAYSVRCIKD